MATNGKIKLACNCRFISRHHVTGCLCLSPSRGDESCAVLPDSKEEIVALSLVLLCIVVSPTQA